jgi:hypothetical protein
MSYLCFDLMIASQPGRFHGLVELETRGDPSPIDPSLMWSGVGGRRAASRAGAGPIWAVGGRADGRTHRLFPPKPDRNHGIFFLSSSAPCPSNS